MYEQISILGENINGLVKNNAKAKRFEYILEDIQKSLQEKENRIVYLDECNKKLEEENKELKMKNSKPKEILELGAFEISKINHRPLIGIFADWIGYEMFVRNSNFDKLPKEKQDTYKEVWNKCVKPAYKEFCKVFANDTK